MIIMTKYFALSLLGVLFLLSSSLGQNLVARLVIDKLPFPLSLSASYYDGESDYIYFMGGIDGSTSTYLSSILRFDLSTEKVEEVGSFPESSSACSLEADSNGNLIYFECDYPPYTIYKFDVVNNSVKGIGQFNSLGTPVYTTSVKNSAGRVIMFGGGLDPRIWEVNVESDPPESKIVGEFLEPFWTVTSTKKVNNTVLVFGDNARVPYLKLDVETLETSDVALNGFPEFQQGMQVTSDTNYVYVFGGNFTSGELSRDGFIRLDTDSHSWEFIKVENFPANSDCFYSRAPEVLWIEKLNRIYMFGGALNNGTYEYLDDIYCIDMNPTN